jgi:hypothetical protein
MIKITILIYIIMYQEQDKKTDETPSTQTPSRMPEIQRNNIADAVSIFKWNKNVCKNCD